MHHRYKKKHFSPVCIPMAHGATHTTAGPDPQLLPLWQRWGLHLDTPWTPQAWRTTLGSGSLLGQNKPCDSVPTPPLEQESKHEPSEGNVWDEINDQEGGVGRLQFGTCGLNEWGNACFVTERAYIAWFSTAPACSTCWRTCPRHQPGVC